MIGKRRGGAAPATPAGRPQPPGPTIGAVVLALLLALPGAASALTVKLALIGPGDALYFWWGHIGVVVDDRFYDWGSFNFENERFFTNFAFGRMLYSCMVSSAGRNLAYNAATNRDVTLYTLDLSEDRKEELRRFAEWNARPENRDYFYHQFRDNCSTRVRDLLDTATGGAFRERYGEAPGRFTYRQHIRRFTWFNPVVDWILNFWMGRGIDQPVTVWDEMFLPSELADRALEFTYIDDQGIERRLVSDVEVVNQAVGRPAPLDAPRPHWPGALALGCALALTLLLSARLAAGPAARPIKRLPWQLLQGVFGLVLGAASVPLVFMAFFTNHDYTYHNMNLLYVTPLLLLALPLQARPRLLRALWALSLVMGIAAAALEAAAPGFRQGNAETLALVLPVAAALAIPRPPPRARRDRRD